MAMTQSVLIYYGPCDTFHTLSYKPQKLTGLRDRLQKLGYRVEIEPVKHENYCLLVLAGHEVFRCNIKNLMFNTPHYHDPVCQRAVAAVVDGSEKIVRARNRLYFLAVLEDNAFMHGKYGLQDHNVSYFSKAKKNKELKRLSPVETCIKCCRILYEENN